MSSVATVNLKLEDLFLCGLVCKARGKLQKEKKKKTLHQQDSIIGTFQDTKNFLAHISILCLNTESSLRTHITRLSVHNINVCRSVQVYQEGGGGGGMCTHVQGDITTGNDIYTSQDVEAPERLAPRYSVQ